MRHLLYYKLTSDFTADQTDVGGDGTKVVSVVNSVARCADTRKIYYRESGDMSDVTPCTVTVHFKWQELTIAPDEVVNTKRYIGKSAKVCLQSKMVEGYTPVHKSYTLTVSGDTEYTFEYNNNYQSVPLTFEIMSGGTIIWKRESNNSPLEVIEYSLNGGDWVAITSTTATQPQISVSDGDIVQFRGNNASYSSSVGGGNIFSGTCTFNIKGNIMSLIKKTGFSELDTLVSAYTFYHLFNGNTGIVSAKLLVLPATTLADNCYNSMFQGCTSLTAAPALPATTLTQSCYRSMFWGCTSLTRAPELPATTLARNCYTYMFWGCTSLTRAPELPATTLTQSCYSSMFWGCTSLTRAPELPATTLAQSCYIRMFYGCTSLTAAPALPATTLTSNCYDGMFYGCTGLSSAPVLPATTLADSCYSSMFYGCTSLNYIKCLATNISASNCTYSWVNGVSSTGTFVKPNATDWSSKTGTNGIPSNWAIQDA